jgi:hypothetical protein
MGHDQTIIECDRCEAKTKNGQRCKRRTCSTNPYCFQHTKSILNLVVKKSNIPKANKGLFTTIDVKKGQNIVPYTGEILNQNQLDSRYGNGQADYTFKVNNNDRYIDARSTKSSIGRYANTNPGHNNASFSIDNRNQKVNIKASKNIKKDGEVYVAYGRNYKL